MEIKSIVYGSRFVRSFKKLSLEVQIESVERELIFRKNCFDPRLKTHKLSGKREGYWSFSIDYSNRVMFEFMESNRVGFLNVGDHSIYQ
jgi:mRNA-degrading endonuclease YafQ of YafQ-DinJ toxin-antitoxin module